MSKFKIICLKPEEWQEYKSIRLESLKSDPQAFFATFEENEQRPDSYWQERLIKAQERKNNWLLFAQDGSKIIGIIGAFMKEHEDIAHIISLYVTQDSRGKGISKMLLKSILIELEKISAIKKIRLAVNVDQVSALNLYKNFNFQIVEKKHSLLGDGKYHDEFVMFKSLK